MRIAGIKVTDNDLRDVLSKVYAQGGVISKCNNSHFRVVPPDKSKPVVFMPSTPSDFRSIKNVVGKLRRAGFLI